MYIQKRIILCSPPGTNKWLRSARKQPKPTKIRAKLNKKIDEKVNLVFVFRDSIAAAIHLTNQDLHTNVTRFGFLERILEPASDAILDDLSKGNPSSWIRTRSRSGIRTRVRSRFLQLNQIGVIEVCSVSRLLDEDFVPRRRRSVSVGSDWILGREPNGEFCESNNRFSHSTNIGFAIFGLTEDQLI